MDTSFIVVRRPCGPSQKVAYTTSACIANKLPQGTETVLVYCSSAAYVKVGWGASSITATTADIPIPANTYLTIPVPRRHQNDAAGADSAFVAAVQDSTGGNLFVQPMAE